MAEEDVMGIQRTPLDDAPPDDDARRSIEMELLVDIEAEKLLDTTTEVVA